MANEFQLPDWLQFPTNVFGACWTLILGAAGAVYFILQAYNLYLQDQRPITWISVVVILAILIGFLLIISFSKKKDEDSKPLRYPKGCRFARLGLLLVAILTVDGASRVFTSYRNARESIVLVMAGVDNAQPNASKVVERLRERVKKETPEKTLIRQLSSTVRDQQEAQALFERYGGRVVIWFRTESHNGEERIIIQLESLEQSNKTTGGPRAKAQTISHSEIILSSDQVEGRALYIAGLARYEAEQYDKAITLFTDALKKGDWQRDSFGIAYLYFLRGNCFYFSGHPQEAFEDYGRAIEGNPGLAQAYFNRGLVYSEKNDEKAVEDYTEAIRLYAGTDAGAYNNRGLLYIELAKLKNDRSLYELAIRDFNDAVRIDPQYAEAFEARGDAHSFIGVGLSETEEKPNAERQTYFNRALADYSKAIDLKPTYASPYIGRADTYYELKLYERAIADCTVAVDLDPKGAKSAKAYYNAGRAFYKQGKFGLAVDNYSQANLIDSNDSDILYNRAAAYFDWAKSQDNRAYYERALTDYNTILSTWPNITQVYLDRGETLLKLERCSDAKKDFRKALDSDDAEIREQAQDWLRESSECEEAREPIKLLSTLVLKMTEG